MDETYHLWSRNATLRCTPQPWIRKSRREAWRLCFTKPSRRFCWELMSHSYWDRCPSMVSSPKMPSLMTETLAAYSSELVFSLTKRRVSSTAQVLSKHYLMSSSDMSPERGIMAIPIVQRREGESVCGEREVAGRGSHSRDSNQHPRVQWQCPLPHLELLSRCVWNAAILFPTSCLRVPLWPSFLEN